MSQNACSTRNLRFVIADINIVIMVYDDGPVAMARTRAMALADSLFGMAMCYQQDRSQVMKLCNGIHLPVQSVVVEVKVGLSEFVGFYVFALVGRYGVS